MSNLCEIRVSDLLSPAEDRFLCSSDADEFLFMAEDLDSVPLSWTLEDRVRALYGLGVISKTQRDQLLVLI